MISQTATDKRVEERPVSCWFCNCEAFDWDSLPYTLKDRFTGEVFTITVCSKCLTFFYHLALDHTSGIFGQISHVLDEELGRERRKAEKVPAQR
jgi:hypothetical protein